MDYQAIAIESAKILIGVGIGTVFTVWYKDIKAKREDRKYLFVRMVASKGYLNIPQSLIDDLNTIEIIFRGRKGILQKYHAYYAELCVPEGQENFEKQQALYWDLLRAIGNEVGYRNLDNSTLNAQYIPRGVWKDHLSTREFQAEVLKYVKSGTEMQLMLIAQMKASQQSPGIEEGNQQQT